MKRLGIDIGSTTIKSAVVDEEGNIIWSTYERHQSKINLKLSGLVHEIRDKFPLDKEMIVAFSGSAGMGMAESLSVPFVQEVYATRTAVREREKDCDVVIELGGEDAKILFLTGGVEVRMNGSCAGGTGAFIDQMAQLMGITPTVMNDMAHNSSRRYVIASRCGVFAKSDIQPLLNQGAGKEDIAASIYYAVVNQTVAGLSQSREIKGNVLYLGGPLTFSSYLRFAFDDVLKTKGRCPDDSLLFVAYGSAISCEAERRDLESLEEKARLYSSSTLSSLPPLFSDQKEYRDFLSRHEMDSRGIRVVDKPKGNLYLGLDSGSTTLKAVMVDEEGNLFRPLYVPNKGNPVKVVKEYLEAFYRECPDATISSSAVTGYGEDIVKAAFNVDYGVVETIAHFTAAKLFDPDVDFIIDIGGQDIKCFRIRNGAIDSLFLNEACSSGCGSFLETFASLLGYKAEEFASLAVHSRHPVDLGSRCTVFMNSLVKEAQKNGAGVEDISAGLAISVVRNALYKVIRTPDPSLLGDNIVVQGGTFLNDGVLRAFEKETGKNVRRPSVAGLMGAYGAALWAKEKSRETGKEKSSIITISGLESFVHSAKSINCNGCSNHCHLTMNDFGRGEKFIAGNRCDKPLGKKRKGEGLNLYEYKRNVLSSFSSHPSEKNLPVVGMTMTLGIWELLPFWHTLFSSLGFGIEISSPSTHEIYTKGQGTIPSDTACYPAKLVHGHTEDLMEKGVDYIFMPCLTYNIDEKKGDNHYNCPVVAYYPEVIKGNVRLREGVKLLTPFLDISERKRFPKYFALSMESYGIKLDRKEVEKASEKAYRALEDYKRDIEREGRRILEEAEREHMPLVVLSGRPYHVDREISHGIDSLINSLGAAVVSEDSVAFGVDGFRTMVLNQWTYHNRLYGAAKWVRDQKRKDIVMVQLVSFGCGVDAITGDEVRSIIESGGGIYTQIKIDEISNLGAVKIRLRSLLAVMGAQ